MTTIKSKVQKPGALAYAKGLLFGPPKTGKTTAGASGAKTLLIELEPDGDVTTSLRGRKDVDVFKPSTPRELQGAVESLHGAEKNTWDFVTVDSITYMVEFLAGDTISKKITADEDPRRAYQKVGVAVNQILGDIMLLPMHVVILSQMKILDGSQEGTPLNPEHGQYPLTLDVSPMVYRMIAPAVSFIGRTYKKREYVEEAGKKKIATGFYVSFDDGGRSPAGSRLELPAEMANFDMNKVAALLTKEGGK